MKLSGVVLVLAAVVGAAVVEAVRDAKKNAEYCDKAFCNRPNDEPHIGCNNNEQFSTTCPKAATLVNINSKLQEAILSEFNSRRNQIAGGKERGLKPACNMGAVSWNAELAKLAEYNVKRCYFGHDCHQTSVFRISGQNIFSASFSGNFDVVEKFKKAIDMWYGEIQHANAAAVRQYPKNVPSDKEIGHFIAMVNHRNNQIGCAASTQTPPGQEWTQFLFTCNFATNHGVGSTAYNECATPATKCETGKDKKYKHLCSTSEKYDYSSINRL